MTDRPWSNEARAALYAARDGNWAQAGAHITAIVNEHGPDVIIDVVINWIDTVAAAVGDTYGGNIAPKFQADETGVVGSAEQVAPEIAWAGQLIAARHAMDEAMFDALLLAVPDTDDAWQVRIAAVLNICANRLKFLAVR